MDDRSGPPLGWRERRRSVERRFPEVIETDLSLFEWQEYFVAWKNGRVVRVSIESAPVYGQAESGQPET